LPDLLRFGTHGFGDFQWIRTRLPDHAERDHGHAIAFERCARFVGSEFDFCHLAEAHLVAAVATRDDELLEIIRRCDTAA